MQDLYFYVYAIKTQDESILYNIKLTLDKLKTVTNPEQ